MLCKIDVFCETNRETNRRAQLLLQASFDKMDEILAPRPQNCLLTSTVTESVHNLNNN